MSYESFQTARYTDGQTDNSQENVHKTQTSPNKNKTNFLVKAAKTYKKRNLNLNSEPTVPRAHVSAQLSHTIQHTYSRAAKSVMLHDTVATTAAYTNSRNDDKLE